MLLIKFILYFSENFHFFITFFHFHTFNPNEQQKCVTFLKVKQILSIQKKTEKPKKTKKKTLIKQTKKICEIKTVLCT